MRSFRSHSTEITDKNSSADISHVRKPCKNVTTSIPAIACAMRAFHQPDGMCKTIPPAGISQGNSKSESDVTTINQILQKLYYGGNSSDIAQPFSRSLDNYEGGCRKRFTTSQHGPYHGPICHFYCVTPRITTLYRCPSWFSRWKLCAASEAGAQKDGAEKVSWVNSRGNSGALGTTHGSAAEPLWCCWYFWLRWGCKVDVCFRSEDGKWPFVCWKVGLCAWGWDCWFPSRNRLLHLVVTLFDADKALAAWCMEPSTMFRMGCFYNRPMTVMCRLGSRPIYAGIWVTT